MALPTKKIRLGGEQVLLLPSESNREGVTKERLWPKWPIPKMPAKEKGLG
jgi:hypothetical protein